MLDTELTRQALCNGPGTAAFLSALTSTAEQAAHDFQLAFQNAAMGRKKHVGAPAAGTALSACMRAALCARTCAEEQGILANAGELLTHCQAQFGGASTEHIMPRTVHISHGGNRTGLLLRTRSRALHADAHPCAVPCTALINREIVGFPCKG